MLPLVIRSPWTASALAAARSVALAGCWILLGWAVAANLGLSGRIAWFLEIPANFPTLVSAAILGGAIGVYLLGKRPARLAAVGLALVAFAAGWWSAPAILSAKSGEPALTLSLMTWNTKVGALDPAAVAKEIRGMNPDLVAFTEFTPDFRDAITPLLAEDFPYHPESAERGHSGSGVYSKLPISEWKRLPEKRAAVTFRVELPNGKSCATLLLHADVPVCGGYEKRARFLQAGSNELDGYDGPLLVLGDFNASWASADLRAFCEAHDLMVASRLVPSWNSGYPPILRAAIDHVLVSQRHFVSLSARAGSSGTGGDHLPVMATLKVVEAPAHRPRE